MNNLVIYQNVFIIYYKNIKKIIIYFKNNNINY